MRTTENERALRLVERLMKVGGATGRKATKMHQRLMATPMAVILDKLPAGSVVSRARRLGVSRQTYYYWLDGTTRPNNAMAKKLHKLTGVSVEEIRGHPE